MFCVPRARPAHDAIRALATEVKAEPVVRHRDSRSDAQHGQWPGPECMRPVRRVPSISRDRARRQPAQGTHPAPDAVGEHARRPLQPSSPTNCATPDRTPAASSVQPWSVISQTRPKTAAGTAGPPAAHDTNGSAQDRRRPVRIGRPLDPVRRTGRPRADDPTAIAHATRRSGTSGTASRPDQAVAAACRHGERGDGGAERLGHLPNAHGQTPAVACEPAHRPVGRWPSWGCPRPCRSEHKGQSDPDVTAHHHGQRRGHRGQGQTGGDHPVARRSGRPAHPRR